MNEFLILVDKNDVQIGKLEKLQVHQLGLLHRAFSIFIFNSKGELLLQQRADGKYHSGGLWTNTCCSHPVFGEEMEIAVNRRLMQEMGMSCKLSFVFSFIYEEKLDHNLIENEYDHVYFGLSDDLPSPNFDEVQNWKYLSLEELENDIVLNSQKYTAWLKIAMPEIKNQFVNYFINQNP